MSKYLDSNGLLYLWIKIKSALAGKVDKVEGKGLSSEDFTSDDKNKLDGLSNYTLPTASSATKGGVRIGTGLTMTGDVLSATGGGKADSVEWVNILNKPDVAVKSDITGLYKYKGSVATYYALPSTGNVVGDVWNVEASGMNYAWDGTQWDALGQSFEIQAITNAEIDTITSD